MDEMRDKMKGFMKKVNTPFSSSSSGKFKGQGRVLGSSSSSSSSSQIPSSSSVSNPRPSPQKVSNSADQKLESKKPEIKVNSSVESTPENEFDPFNPLITSGKRNPNGYALKVFECPVCGKGYPSEEEVSVHIESCLSTADSVDKSDSKESDGIGNQLQTCVSVYRSGKPSDASIEVVMRILKNIVKEPGNAKFRKIRMGNPKIKEAIGDVPGGVELLECIGFELKEEDGEIFLVVDDPSEECLGLVKNVISLLEPKAAKELPSPAPAKKDDPPAKIEEPVESKPADRQVHCLIHLWVIVFYIIVLIVHF